MAVLTIKAVLACDPERVWETVTDLAHASWRSDLSRLEVLSPTEFVEYTKDGFPTSFTVTAAEPCRRWEFDMENANMKGHWTGVFRGRDGGTELVFTEAVTPKKWWMRPLAKGYLKRQQERYIADLKRAVLE